jgi:phosphoribosylanthranilate isomerase
MRVFVKICGIATAEGALAARQSGADAAGFVFSPSPRQVTLEAALTLAAIAGDGISKVAVLRFPSLPEVARIALGFKPDRVQCEAMDDDPPGWPGGAGFLPVVHDGPRALEEAERLSRGGAVLLEPAGAGGTGTRADWDRAAEIARRVPLILAGGLCPENVEEAILRVRPFGVDVSSGVESGPGRKDPERISRFVAAVRRAENALISRPTSREWAELRPERSRDDRRS